MNRVLGSEAIVSLAELRSRQVAVWARKVRHFDLGTETSQTCNRTRHREAARTSDGRVVIA
jgi:hypothetical protein